MKRCLACERCFSGEGWGCPGCGFAPASMLGFPAFANELSPEEIGFDASRYGVLAQKEAEHFWFVSRAELIVWVLQKRFPAAASLLEIGCGTGNVLAAIAGRMLLSRLAASEAHAGALVYAARRAPGAELMQMDARHIPFRDEFDVVGAFDVIEHIDEDSRVLDEMFAACRPGGGIVLTVPQHEWLWSFRDEFARHRRRYRRRDLLKKLAAAGFEKPWTTSFVSLLLPLMAASRLRQRHRRRFDPSRELEIGRGANRILGAVMALERRLIASGFSLPVGGSLLVTAHKPRGDG